MYFLCGRGWASSVVSMFRYGCLSLDLSGTWYYWWSLRTVSCSPCLFPVFALWYMSNGVLLPQRSLLRARWRMRRRVAWLGFASLSVWRVAVVEERCSRSARGLSSWIYGPSPPFFEFCRWSTVVARRDDFLQRALIVAHFWNLFSWCLSSSNLVVVVYFLFVGVFLAVWLSLFPALSFVGSTRRFVFLFVWGCLSGGRVLNLSSDFILVSA